MSPSHCLCKGVMNLKSLAVNSQAGLRFCLVIGRLVQKWEECICQYNVHLPVPIVDLNFEGLCSVEGIKKTFTELIGNWL